MTTIHYNVRFRCRNRGVDKSGNVVPMNPEICESVGCRQRIELREDQMDFGQPSIYRCAQGPEGDPKYPGTQRVWERLAL